MRITAKKLRRIIREAQWGRFTGGAAPLDEPPLDSGNMDPEQQQRVFDILVSTGSDPKELKASGEYPDVIIQEMARPKLKYAVKVERLANAVIDLMMEYEKNERATDPNWQPSVQLSVERKLFHEADEALTKLVEILKESDK